MKRPKSEYVIQTVTNALRLLEAFRAQEELGVTELSRILDLHKNNVFRLLATLEEKGFVEQCRDSDRYRLGLACLELGVAFTRNRSLARHARVMLEELARTTGESAHLGALSGFSVVHLDGEAGSHLVGSSLRMGCRLDPHATALGKVLLAFADATQREQFYQEWLESAQLEAHTPSTIVDSHKLLDHLGTVASRGYALDLEELESGLACASTPVHDAAGSVVAALSISGPAHRLTEAVLLTDIVPHLLEASTKLSRDLGYTTR